MSKIKTQAAGQKGLFQGEKAKNSDGYYSGDKPNPNLRAFVEQHLREKPYDPAADDYEVPAFNKPIETTKATAIYNMHTYWSKKPHEAVRQYIRHYTQPGDLVLDPFCGSGGTALAALMDGRKAIAIDRSPAATFITKNYCTPVDPAELREAFEQVKAKVKDEIEWLYETHCDGCDGKADIYSTVFSATYKCSRCLKDVPLFHALSEKTGFNKVTYYCPHCDARGIREEISLRSERNGSWPMMLTYYCRSSSCKNAKEPGERRFPFPQHTKDHQDLRHLAEVAKRPVQGSVPRIAMMFEDEGKWGLLQRPYHGDIRFVSDFYSDRNLRAVAMLLQTAREILSGNLRDAMLFAIEAISMNMSKLQGYSTNPQFPNNMMKGTLYTPPVWREYNVLDWLRGKIKNLVAGYSAIGEAGIAPEDVVISTQSVCDLSNVPDNSVDYIFTDPPYSYKIQFGELNFMWEAWLGIGSNWKAEEIIVNDARGKDELDWAERMRLGIREMCRVLKPGRTMSLCYHDSSEGSWSLLQDLVAECGFVATAGTDAVYIDTDRKSWKQLVADKVTKRDLVINFRKPKPGEFRVTRLVIPDEADLQTFRDLARQVIRDYLQANPGSTKDRVYDELVSRMVRAGTMQAHNFDELLREVAEEAAVPGGGPSRWYLMEAEETQLDASEQQAEDRAAVVMEKFIAKRTDETSAEGVHYSDLFEHYLYAVKEKPRRSLADWLPDYFFKTEAGTWRLPVSDEERELKEGSRVSGANRRVKRFANMLSAGVSIPQNKLPTSPTLAEWIRHAKRAGLYEAGKLLYERGGIELEKLSEELQVAVEEDYQTCIRALQRAAGADVEAKKRGRRKKADDNE